MQFGFSLQLLMYNPNPEPVQFLLIVPEMKIECTGLYFCGVRLYTSFNLLQCLTTLCSSLSVIRTSVHNLCLC
jgi:hypothetical protein